MEISAQVYESLKNSLPEISKKAQEVQKLNADMASSKYTAQYKADTLIPAREKAKGELAFAKSAAISAAKALTAAARKEAKQKNTLNAADISPDVAFLQTGVVLAPGEIEELLQRNDSFTMRTLLCRYAEQNGIRYNPLYKPGHDSSDLDALDFVIDRFKTHIEKQDAEQILDTFFKAD